MSASRPSIKPGGVQSRRGCRSRRSGRRIDGGRSGRSLQRPELQRMLEYIQDRPVDFVIVHKIDRLARNRADDSAIMKTILGAGAYLVSTTEGTSTTPSGRPLHGIMASIAETYSQNLATEVMRGLRQKAIPGGTPGRAPLGHLNERRFDDGREVRTSRSTGTSRVHHLGLPRLRHRQVERHPPGRRTGSPGGHLLRDLPRPRTRPDPRRAQRALRQHHPAWMRPRQPKSP
ncbi:hypothetical protein MLP_45640 [Microlunatus phosphovorus NM-1]|uniref:Resolvase/invertase-type recombinase catalytic domain-containing protein n=1 Tax=Microlunatus phosphovorus (strain ATCC 700054 / DSM 10555 / JCM 9379 / NBRC 101784 / NCIMB 13414 / VKM Ac-1990 / NM-1) TaxID=1032480 RepID=F5XE30_MICPN|nr:hypothetical protein MLP_45640 [Microlunatus phosphovorus NM-1]